LSSMMTHTISKPASNFFELVRARTSSHKLSQARKVQKPVSPKGTYDWLKVILCHFGKK
jgi:hypothetical protein